jgi:phytanoyl-CoA hydroxylase
MRDWMKTGGVGVDTAADSLAAKYRDDGYAVARQVISRAKIEQLLALYQRRIVPSKGAFFRQNTNAYQPNERNAHGYVRQSFLDIHDYARYQDFSRAARDVFCDARLHETLRQVAGFERFNLMQTMLFDLNTATPAHQDWYYLDSVPHGNLIAAWIALEDIDERAGRFYVLPGSHKMDFGAAAAGRTHAEWLGVVAAHVGEHAQGISAPALECGDVLFWNSRTVHGSLPTQDERFSRKSLTAHFLPQQFEFGNLFSTKRQLDYQEHDGVRFYRNQPDDSPWNRVKFKLKTTAYNYPVIREGLRKARDAFNQVRSSGPK